MQFKISLNKEKILFFSIITFGAANGSSGSFVTIPSIKGYNTIIIIYLLMISSALVLWIKVIYKQWFKHNLVIPLYDIILHKYLLLTKF